jgi:hypothetical protein
MMKVRVTIPSDLWLTHVGGASGENYAAVHGPDGERFVMMTPEDARMLIGTPSNLPWRAANEALLRQLGPTPKPTVGTHIAGALTTREAAPRDIGGMSRGIGAARE